MLGHDFATTPLMPRFRADDALIMPDAARLLILFCLRHFCRFDAECFCRRHAAAAAPPAMLR